MPFEYYRWELAERFGWTLEYIDALKIEDFHELLQVDDGKAKAGASSLNKKRKF
jgi:hypothetical protein